MNPEIFSLVQVRPKILVPNETFLQKFTVVSFYTGDDSSRKPAASRPPKAQHPEPEGDPEPEGGGGGRAQQTGRCCCHGNGQASAASAGVGSPGVGSAEWFAELERSLVAPRPLQLWP